MDRRWARRLRLLSSPQVLAAMDPAQRTPPLGSLPGTGAGNLGLRQPAMDAGQPPDPGLPVAPSTLPPGAELIVPPDPAWGHVTAQDPPLQGTDPVLARGRIEITGQDPEPGSLPDLTAIKLLSLAPGDALVVHAAKTTITPAEAAEVESYVRAKLGIPATTRILVISGTAWLATRAGGE